MPAATLALPKHPTAAEARQIAAEILADDRRHAAEAGRSLSRRTSYRLLGHALRIASERRRDAYTATYLSDAAESAERLGRLA